LLTNATLLAFPTRDLAGDFDKNLVEVGVVGVLDATTINKLNQNDSKSYSPFRLNPSLRVEKATPFGYVGPTYDLSSLSWSFIPINAQNRSYSIENNRRRIRLTPGPGWLLLNILGSTEGTPLRKLHSVTCPVITKTALFPLYLGFINVNLELSRLTNASGARAGLTNGREKRNLTARSRSLTQNQI
jgi:hypothetical protein